MPRCCRAGAARRRSSARSRPATTSPASPSCRWTPASTPARCCSPRRVDDRRRRQRRRAAGRASPRSAASSSSQALGALANGRARRPAAARGRRHLRRQDHQGRGDDRLARSRRPTIERRLRAFDPAPGARSVLGGETITCWRGVVAPGRRPAGRDRRRRRRRAHRRLRRGPARAHRAAARRRPAHGGRGVPARLDAARSAPSSTPAPDPRRDHDGRLNFAAPSPSSPATPLGASNLRGHAHVQSARRPPS